MGLAFPQPRLRLQLSPQIGVGFLHFTAVSLGTRPLTGFICLLFA